MASVSYRNVGKIYGSGPKAVHAVEDFSLDVADGEFVALLGPSGCGKTSTLRMTVGLEPITSGDILFNDRRVNDLAPQERNVAMAFETYALYPNFTVEENLAFPLEVRGVPRAERRKAAGRIAEMLHLTSILDQKPGTLSGGQQQRISLGRALIRDPAVFILDEVMSHIDAHLKFQMLLDLKAIHRDLGKTMIYVTHDQGEALALADRVVVMSQARLQQSGTRSDLYNRPVNIFVADFIGEPPTNFFRQASLAGDNAADAVHAADAGLTFKVTPHTAALVRERRPRELVVGLRPQNLTLGPGSATITAAVTVNEYLGERSILTLASGGSEFRALVPPATQASRGDVVTLSYRPEDVMVFDAETESLIV